MTHPFNRVALGICGSGGEAFDFAFQSFMLLSWVTIQQKSLKHFVFYLNEVKAQGKIKRTKQGKGRKVLTFGRKVS